MSRLARSLLAKASEGGYLPSFPRWPRSYCPLEAAISSTRAAPTNPHIRKVGDTYLLLYMGVNYEGPTPSAQSPEVWRSPRYLATWARKRIGLATSRSGRGPGKRLDQPLIEPRPEEWDSIATTNPSLCPLPDGMFLLAYKSRRENLGNLQVGVAHAPHFTGPWTREPTPWLFRGQPAHVEDAFLWYEAGRVQALMKDMTGEICRSARERP